MAVWFCKTGGQSIQTANMWYDHKDGSGTALVWADLGVSDVLCANNKTGIAIDAGFACARISTLAEVGAYDTGDAGGGFTNNAARTITAVLAGPGCLVDTHTTGDLVITGSWSAPTTANGRQLQLNAVGRTILNGSFVGGVSYSRIAVRHDAAMTLIINGDVTASPYSAIYEGGSYGATVIVTGNIINSPASSAVYGPCSYAPASPANYIRYSYDGNAAHYYYFAKTIPAAQVLSGVTGDGAGAPTAGTYCIPRLISDHTTPATIGDILDTVEWGTGPTAGTYNGPLATEVVNTATFGAGNAVSGTYAVPTAAQVISTASFGIGTQGTVIQAAAGDVRSGTHYGPGSSLTGTLIAAGVLGAGGLSGGMY